MDEQHTLPTRRERLRTLLRLRTQRAALVFGIAALVPTTAALAVSGDGTPEPVVIGTGVAGVALEPATNIKVPEAVPTAAEAPVAAIGETVETVADELGIGEASYYGPGLAGRSTANGERFDPTQLTAAHRTLPFGSKVKVTSERTGKSVVVRINDRGPFHGNRVIDLSTAAAKMIGLASRGRGQVRMALLSH